MRYQDICELVSSASSEFSFNCFSDFDYHFSERCKFDFKPQKKVAFIRHDIDHDPFVALEMAKIEAKHGIRSSYFFLTNDSASVHFYDKSCRSRSLDTIAEVESLGHEIGLHYDPIGEFLENGKPFYESISEPLSWFRDQGIKINGCVAHGASRIRKLTQKDVFPLQYANYQLWNDTGAEPKEYEELGEKFTLPMFNLADFGLMYEPYLVRKDRYISDSGGLLWRTWNDQYQPFENIDEVPGINFAEWLAGGTLENEVIQILIHPIWWTRSLGVPLFYYCGKIKPFEHVLASRVYRTTW